MQEERLGFGEGETERRDSEGEGGIGDISGLMGCKSPRPRPGTQESGWLASEPTIWSSLHENGKWDLPCLPRLPCDPFLLRPAGLPPPVEKRTDEKST